MTTLNRLYIYIFSIHWLDIDKWTTAHSLLSLSILFVPVSMSLFIPGTFLASQSAMDRVADHGNRLLQYWSQGSLVFLQISRMRRHASGYAEIIMKCATLRSAPVPTLHTAHIAHSAHSAHCSAHCTLLC